MSNADDLCQAAAACVGSPMKSPLLVASAMHGLEQAMVDNLATKTCTPCRGGVPPLTPEEAEEFRRQVPDWEVRDDARRIERTFRFRNFADAFALVQRVGELAEAEGHHPDIGFGWGYATVSLQTKKIKGLHENDFIMAAKVDAIPAGLSSG